jgi:hypothetical protein
VTAPERPADAGTALLLQITQHAEQLGALDQRETARYQETAGRLSELERQTAEVGGRLDELLALVTRQGAVIEALEGIDQQVAELAGRLAEVASTVSSSGNDGPGEAVPAPRWWKLDGPDRQDALARLRAWIEQVYRPGYGHLAAALGPCWEQHPLCLYGLDWLMELWTILYLTPERDAPVLASQAEWQSRLLPALAQQMAAETTRCRHSQAGRHNRPHLTDGGPG